MSLNKFLLLAVTGLSIARAEACNEIFWIVENKKEAICYDSRHEAMITASCVNKACGATVFLEKARELNLPETPGLVRNPGSPYCKFLKGVVVMGVNERGSQNAFCKASDGTLVDLSALGVKLKK